MFALLAQAPNAAQAQQQQFDAMMKIYTGPIGIAAGLMSLIHLVLLIIIIVKMFQHNQTALGIVTIITSLCCGIGPFIALIFGWMKAGEWNIRPLMAIYTVVLLVTLGLVGYQYSQLFAMMQQMQQQPGKF